MASPSRPERDWDAEIDAWTERFRTAIAPPEPFATALRDGWTAEARAALAADAQAYMERHHAYVEQLRDGGVETVRLDIKGGCDACLRYHRSCYTLGDGADGLTPPPPLPICPACRHTLNMLTPFFLQSLGLSMDDVVAASVPFTPPD